MTNIYPTRTLFYIILVPYLAFYFIFGFILYPSRNFLHSLSFRSNHQGISYVLNLFRYWTFSLYFIVSELWASTGVPLLFWSCANEVYEFDQAKRIYPLMSFIGNFGPVFAGLTMSIVSNFVSKFTKDDEKAFETSLKILTLCITAAGGIVSYLHYKIRAITDKERANQSLSTPWTASAEDPTITQQGSPQEAPKSPRLTLKDSILTLTSSEYLINIAIMVISYCLTFEFSELIWKAAVRSAFPQKNDYLKFMGNYGMFVGTAAFLMMFITTDFLTKFGWKTTALITPLIMTTFASIFFYCLLGKGIQSKSTLLIAVYAGLLNSVLAKATRYAAFDPIKEMAYIQLPSNIRLKGKAAIDVLGARIGKSGGALIQQLLVLWFGNLFNGAGIVAVLFYLTIAVWISKFFIDSTLLQSFPNLIFCFVHLFLFVFLNRISFHLSKACRKSTEENSERRGKVEEGAAAN
jgi:AAA family ATP:ADP antiporter